MAVWQVVIEKQLGSEYWVNDYHIEAPDAIGASTQAGSIVAIERTVHSTLVGFTKYRIRPAGSSAQGTVYPIGLPGQNNGIGAYLPLYNTARIDMAPASGRVGRKYLKCPVSQAAQSDGAFNSGFLSYINTNYCQPLMALGYVCKDNGDLFVTAACQPAVQMRQLRRGSKRRLQPII